MCFIVIDLTEDVEDNRETFEEICTILGTSKLRNCGNRTKDVFVVAGELDENLTRKQAKDLLYIFSHKVDNVLDASVKDDIDQYPDLGDIKVSEDPWI